VLFSLSLSLSLSLSSSCLSADMVQGPCTNLTLDQ
jgi:hypothetical protein